MQADWSWSTSLPLGGRACPRPRARPDLFPALVGVSGRRFSTLDDPATTVDRAFGDDAALVAGVHSMREPAADRQPFAIDVLPGATAGRADAAAIPDAVSAATGGAPKRVLPGGHAWPLTGTALDRALPRLTAPWGLLP